MNFLEALSVLFRERERERERERFFSERTLREETEVMTTVAVMDYPGLRPFPQLALAAHIFNIRCATLFSYLLFSLRSLIEYNHKSPSQ